MREEILNQLTNFGIYALCGFLIGIFFDIFRILRKSFKTSNLITYIEDTIFGVITGLFLIFMLFDFNNGEIRLYIFVALSIGLILYFLLISKFFIKINVTIITFLKKVFITIAKIIFKPFRKIAIFLIVKPKKLLLNIFRQKKKHFFIKKKELNKKCRKI